MALVKLDLSHGFRPGAIRAVKRLDEPGEPRFQLTDEAGATATVGDRSRSSVEGRPAHRLRAPCRTSIPGQFGSVSGTVLDQDGRPIAGATVTIYLRVPSGGAISGRDEHKVRTDAQGRYRPPLGREEVIRRRAGEALGHRVQGRIRGRRDPDVRVPARATTGPRPSIRSAWVRVSRSPEGSSTRRAGLWWERRSGSREAGRRRRIPTARGRRAGSPSRTWAGASPASGAPSARSRVAEATSSMANRSRSPSRSARRRNRAAAAARAGAAAAVAESAKSLPTGSSAAGPTARNDRSANCGAGSSSWISGTSKPVRTLLPALDRLRQKFEPRGVVFLSIHTPDGSLDQIRKLYRAQQGFARLGDRRGATGPDRRRDDRPHVWGPRFPLDHRDRSSRQGRLQLHRPGQPGRPWRPSPSKLGIDGPSEPTEEQMNQLMRGVPRPGHREGAGAAVSGLAKHGPALGESGSRPV